MIIDGIERYRGIVPDWNAFREALDRPLPLCIWTNTLRTSDDRVRAHLTDLNVDTEPLAWRPHAFRAAPNHKAGKSLAFLAGLYHIQEEVSMIPVQLLDPHPGERLLDMCAAPGNKAAQAAVAMKNSGTIVANDRSAIRMRATRGVLDRLGVVNTTITTTDAARYPVDAGSFDKVLADVPCTCEGTSRKHPGAFAQAGRSRSQAMQETQVQILSRAVDLCRPGGRIVYATCTYAPEENELVVDAVLRQFGERIRIMPASIEGLGTSSGITHWNGRALHPDLEGAMRIWPHVNDTGGFFVAVLEKSIAAGQSTRTYHSNPGDARTADSREPADRAHLNGSHPKARRPQAAKPVTPSERRKKWTDLLAARFGIPPAVLSRLDFLEPNNKYVAAVCADHEPVLKPEPVSTGMPLIRIGLKHPKLTTAGARLVGAHATRNVVDVTDEQATAYLNRRAFSLKSAQRSAVSCTGYVILRRNGVILGVGLYFEDAHRVESMFPKILSRAFQAE